MIFPLEKDKGEFVARLTGVFDQDELYTGEYLDSFGNVFRSKKYDVKEVKGIEEFINNYF
jgi:hypothetical protein